MITGDFCRIMARYNMWQNNQLIGLLKVMDDAEIRRDRGGLFGGILGTLNHLIWGDAIWTSRFDGGEAHAVAIEQSPGLFPDPAAWMVARVAMDARVSRWAGTVGDERLRGVLKYYSGVAKREMSKPMALCVMQLFNHQTHHRGQVHAMLTAAGSGAPVSDLPFMPDAD